MSRDCRAAGSWGSRRGRESGSRTPPSEPAKVRLRRGALPLGQDRDGNTQVSALLESLRSRGGAPASSQGWDAPSRRGWAGWAAAGTRPVGKPASGGGCAEVTGAASSQPTGPRAHVVLPWHGHSQTGRVSLVTHLPGACGHHTGSVSGGLCWVFRHLLQAVWA